MGLKYKKVEIVEHGYEIMFVVNIHFHWTTISRIKRMFLKMLSIQQEFYQKFPKFISTRTTIIVNCKLVGIRNNHC